MKDLIFRNLHDLKHEILKKSRRVIFFRFLYFPYVSKGSKKGCKFDLDNYRQISLLSVISKLFELIIRNRVVSFLERFSILSDSQHGFRKGRSTESASAKLFEFVYNEVDKGNYVVTILFDLSKAFDSVNKDILVEDILVDKLEAIGIRGNLLECISSFMQNRSLSVKCNEVQSDFFDICLGVPQGSILGLLLFLIYINDLPRFIKNGFITMYADDTTISVSASSPDELCSQVKMVLEEMNIWCDRNRLILNKDKTIFAILP